jgi:hypothetical protein
VVWTAPANHYLDQVAFAQNGSLLVVESPKLGSPSLYEVASSGRASLVANGVDALVSAGQVLRSATASAGASVLLAAGRVGPLKLGSATQATVARLFGAPTRVFKDTAAGTPPGDAPVLFMGGPLWEYDALDGYSLFGFHGVTLTAFGSTETRFVAYGHIRVGSSLAIAKTVPGASYASQVQCPGVTYPSPKDYTFVLLTSTTAGRYWYDGAPGANFSACGS